MGCGASILHSVGVSPDELAARVLGEHVPGRRRLSFIGLGRSGHDDTSERHKEILAQAFAPKSA